LALTGPYSGLSPVGPLVVQGSGQSRRTLEGRAMGPRVRSFQLGIKRSALRVRWRGAWVRGSDVEKQVSLDSVASHFKLSRHGPALARRLADIVLRGSDLGGQVLDPGPHRSDRAHRKAERRRGDIEFAVGASDPMTWSACRVRTGSRGKTPLCVHLDPELRWSEPWSGSWLWGYAVWLKKL
jgi:hypothetical protein